MRLPVQRLNAVIGAVQQDQAVAGRLPRCHAPQLPVADIGRRKDRQRDLFFAHLAGILTGVMNHGVHLAAVGVQGGDNDGLRLRL